LGKVGLGGGMSEWEVRMLGSREGCEGGFKDSRCWDWICGHIGGGTGVYFELW
jgi:hypothetical protein